MVFEFDADGMPILSKPDSSPDSPLKSALKSLQEKISTLNPENGAILRDVLGHFLLAAGKAERNDRGGMDEHLAAASHKADVLIQRGQLNEGDVITVDTNVRKLLKKDP